MTHAPRLNGTTKRTLLIALSALAVAGPTYGQIPDAAQAGANALTDGVLHIDLLGGEFSEFQDRVEFYDAPNDATVRWSEIGRASTSARWELVELNANPNANPAVVAEGDMAGAPFTAGTQTSFSLDLTDYLPVHNDGAEARHYAMHVVSTSLSGRGGRTSTRTSRPVRLVHLPKSSQAGVARRDPYACPPRRDGYQRRVTLRLQAINSFNNTETFNEGKDEIYFKVVQTSNTASGLSTSAVEHMPMTRHPITDELLEDHFSIEEGEVAQLGELMTMLPPDAWRALNPALDRQTRIASFLVEEGDVYAFTVNIQEDDADAVADVKVVLQALATAASGVATALGAPYVAAGITAAKELGIDNIPPIESDDFLGTFTVFVDNKCGFIRMNWGAPQSISSGSSEVSQSFILLGGSAETGVTINNVDTAPVVIFADDPDNTTFNPYGWSNYDFLGFATPTDMQHQGNMNWHRVDLLLNTEGTSNGSHRFKLRASTRMPETD